MVLEQATQRKRDLRRRYKISPEQYDLMLQTQGGVCAICRGLEEGKRLHIDHDHDTDSIRGLLCGKCNRGLGNFDDSVDLLLQAINYLHHR